MTSQENGLHTLGRWLSDQARTMPTRIAIDDRSVTIKYAELERRSERLADLLVTAGYQHGARIATLTGNCADHVVALFACAKAGLVLMPLSWRLTPAEIAAQLAIGEPSLFVVEEEFLPLARQVAQVSMPAVQQTVLGASGVEVKVPPAPVPQTGMRPAVHDNDPLLMVFTSGTQGPPKAAVLTHSNCFWTNLSLGRAVPMSQDDVVLATLPQFHVGGWNIQPLLAWWSGARVVMERTFDPGRVLRLIEDRGITQLMAVPTQYQMLTEHPDFEASDLRSLRIALVGGSPMPAALLRVWHRRGVRLIQGYGLTEASPNVLCLPEGEASARIGWSGKPYPHVDVALADPVTGELLEGPGSGELIVSGPGVFAGYFRDEAATAQVLRNGWLYTGDIAERDSEGCLRIVDRLKNIYISGGENVAPAEVEDVLLRHPAVERAAVVGVPHARWGEVGFAFVVRRSGVPVDELVLTQFCREHLAGFKVPQHLAFVNDLPFSGLEKVQRARLREQALDLLPMATVESDRHLFPVGGDESSDSDQGENP